MGFVRVQVAVYELSDVRPNMAPHSQTQGRGPDSLPKCIREVCEMRFVCVQIAV